MRSVELSMKRDSKEAEAVKTVLPSALDMLGKGRGGYDRARPRVCLVHRSEKNKNRIWTEYRQKFVI